MMGDEEALASGMVYLKIHRMVRQEFLDGGQWSRPVLAENRQNIGYLISASARP